MQDKWPKWARENKKKKTACRTHPDHTRGTQQLIHQLVINEPYTEYEASNGYVFISSNKQEFKQGGSWWVRNLWSSLIWDRH